MHLSFVLDVSKLIFGGMQYFEHILKSLVNMSLICMQQIIESTSTFILVLRAA